MSSPVRTILFVTLVTGLALAVIPVSAQLDTVTGNFGIPTDDSKDALENRLKGIINAFLGLVSIIAAAAVMYGGVKYVISAGDDKAVGTAKHIILYAVVGLIVIGLAALIVNFTINAINNEDGGGGGGQGQGGQGQGGGAGGGANR